MKNESLEGRAKRLSQLTPFKKGLISNPHGRGIGKDLWRWAAKLGAPEKLVEPMRKLFNIPYGKLSVESAIVLRLALEALRGDMTAVVMWLDRIYGKVTTPLDVSTTTNGPLVQILNLTKSFRDEKVIEGAIVDAAPLPPPEDLSTPPPTP